MSRCLAVMAVSAALLAAGCSSSSSSTAPAAVPSSSGVATFTPAASPGTTQPVTTPPAPVSAASSIPGVTPVATAGQPQTAPDVPRVTGSVSGPCHLTGTPPNTLPDPRCTPGSYDPRLTAAVICAPGYDVEANRPPTTGIYGTTRAKYGVIWPAYGLPRTVAGELNHLIPRGLGGNNTLANLDPEPGKIPNPGDRIENALRRWVRAAEKAGNDALAEGRLAGARQEITRNWITALDVLNVPKRYATTHVHRSFVTSRPVHTRVSYRLPVTHHVTYRPQPPVTHSATPIPAACYPKTSGGACYKAGEFCRKSDLGTIGVAGNGERIRCAASGSRNRWEPA